MARARKQSGATPATVALTKLGIEFRIRSYEHDPSVTDYGAEAAEKLGVDASRVYKTLLVEADGTLVVGIVPVDRKLDLKAIASAVGARKSTMADPVIAERKTGYVVGGISPIGQRANLSTVLDDTAVSFESILVSGGRRGLDIELHPDDLVRATAARIARISRC